MEVVSNTTKLITVNGEYQPVAEALEPGWQSIAISNQTGQAYYNIQFNHITGSSSDDEDHQTLPMFVYGEDGWQYPQIQRAKGTLGSTSTDDSVPKTNYTSLDDTLTVAPGKRFDVLVYLPEGRTDMSSIMNFEKDGEPYVMTIWVNTPIKQAGMLILMVRCLKVLVNCHIACLTQ